MKKNYYCLVAGLPDWKPDDRKSPITWQQLRDEIDETLRGDDLRLSQLFYLPFDHANIVSKLYKTGATFDNRGKYTEAEIDQMTDSLAVSLGDTPVAETYIADAIANYYAQEPRPTQQATAALLQLGWTDALTTSGNEFVARYAQFDTTLRNILIALQGRKYNREVADNIIGTDEIAESIRRSRAHDFGLKSEVDYIEQAIQIFNTTDLVEREMKIDALKWTFIDETTFFDYFTVERIVAAILKLSMVERWAALDEQQGRERFAQIIADIKQSYDNSKK